MPRKLRTPKTRIDGASETAFWFLGDHRLYAKPEKIDTWEELALECLQDKRRKTWGICRETILADWRKKFPNEKPPAASQEFD